MSTNDSSAELQQGGRCVLGVHLDIDSLRVVETSHGRISNWASLPYPAGLTPASKDFPAFLKSSLAGFHSAFHRSAIWVVGPTPSLQVRFLALPKARPRQMAHLVYWTFRKEIPFDAAQTIFDYDVEGDWASSGAAKKMDATAYTVAQADVDAVVDLFERAGLHVEGVVIPSFALRNLFRNQALPHAAPVLGLYVGEDSSSLLFFKGKHVVSHRVFKTGMNVMLDVLRDRHPDWSPAKTYQTIGAALVSSESEAGAGEAGSEEIRGVSETVRAAFTRLVQQVERSMSAYLVGRSEEEIRNLYVAGSMAGLAPLVKELGSKLGLVCQPLNLFKPAHMESGAKLPAGPEEAGMMAIALGAAWSDTSHTPNLLHTYVKRMQELRASRWRMAGAILGIAGLALLIIAGTLTARLNRRLDADLKFHQAQIAKFVPGPDRAMIQSMVNKAIANSMQMKGMAGRSLPVAALNQLAAQTPADIRLTAVALASEGGEGEKGAGRRAKKSAEKAVPRILIHVEGMVMGPPGSQESKLASYMLRLEDNEMFNQVAMTRSEEGREGRSQVLLFGLDMKMDDLSREPRASADLSTQEGATP